jgi:hypothetical protein
MCCWGAVTARRVPLPSDALIRMKSFIALATMLLTLVLIWWPLILAVLSALRSLALRSLALTLLSALRSLALRSLALTLRPFALALSLTLSLALRSLALRSLFLRLGCRLRLTLRPLRWLLHLGLCDRSRLLRRRL